MSDPLTLAQNFETDSAQLIELSGSPSSEVRQAVATNPNTPPSILITLAKEYFDEIGSNPALKLILLENPNFLVEIAKNYYQDYYYSNLNNHQSITLPDWFLPLALHHGNDLVRTLAALGCTSSVDLKNLSTDSSQGVRCEVALNPHTLGETLAQMSKDDDPFVRERVAFNSNTPPLILKRLNCDPDFSVRSCLARNRKLPLPILKQLAKDTNSSIRESIATNSRTPLYLLRKLAKDPEREVRFEVARNSRTPKYLCQQLVFDCETSVRDAAETRLIELS